MCSSAPPPTPPAAPPASSPAGTEALREREALLRARDRERRCRFWGQETGSPPSSLLPSLSSPKWPSHQRPPQYGEKRTRLREWEPGELAQQFLLVAQNRCPMNYSIRLAVRPPPSPPAWKRRAGGRAFRPDVRPFKMMLQVCVCVTAATVGPSLLPPSAVYFDCLAPSIGPAPLATQCICRVSISKVRIWSSLDSGHSQMRINTDDQDHGE